jgi:LacI family transcriptional regulator
VRIPSDCAVIGFDDLPLAPYLAPPLTSVHVPFLETGELAVRLLLERIGEGGEAYRRELLPVSLEIRESTVGPKEAAWRG